MMKRWAPLLAILACGALPAAPAQAQASAAVPAPTILYIERESVKPGGSVALELNRTARARILDRMHWPRPRLALRSLSGPQQVWYFDFCSALVDLEAAPTDDAGVRPELQKLAAQEGDFLSGQDAMTTLFEKDLSYQPDFDWRRVRYVDLITVHVRAGHHLDYLELRHMSRDGHIRGGLTGPLLVYKVTSGTRGLVWLIIRPLESLRQHDDLRAAGFGEPLTPEQDRRMELLRASSMQSAEERFFRVDPQLSHVPATWIGAGEHFWTATAH